MLNKYLRLFAFFLRSKRNNEALKIFGLSHFKESVAVIYLPDSGESYNLLPKTGSFPENTCASVGKNMPLQSHPSAQHIGLKVRGKEEKEIGKETCKRFCFR